MKTIRFVMEMSVTDDADSDILGEFLFEYLLDVENLPEMIDSIDGWDVEDVR